MVQGGSEREDSSISIAAAFLARLHGYRDSAVPARGERRDLAVRVPAAHGDQ
jgi:hypothetical protein